MSTTDQSPEAVVRAFFKAWEEEGFIPAFDRHFAENGAWLNSGFPPAEGKPAVMALLDEYLALAGMEFGRVELKHIAVAGDTAVTERVDHLYSRDRSREHSAAIAGALTVRDGKITRYADYFDPRQFFEMAEGGGH